MATYTIDCPVCGGAVQAGATSSEGAVYSDCACGYLRLTPAGETWIRDAGAFEDEDGKPIERGYTLTRGLHVTTEEADGAGHLGDQGRNRRQRRDGAGGAGESGDAGEVEPSGG